MAIIIFFSTVESLLFSSQAQDYYLRTEYRIKSIPDYFMSLKLISNLIDFQQSKSLARNVIIPIYR